MQFGFSQVSLVKTKPLHTNKTFTHKQNMYKQSLYTQTKSLHTKSQTEPAKTKLLDTQNLEFLKTCKNKTFTHIKRACNTSDLKTQLTCEKLAKNLQLTSFTTEAYKEHSSSNGEKEQRLRGS